MLGPNCLRLEVSFLTRRADKSPRHIVDLNDVALILIHRSLNINPFVLRNKDALGLNLILKFVIEEVDCDFIWRWLEYKVSVLEKRKKARITCLLSPRLKTRIWSDEQPHALGVGPTRLGRYPSLVDRHR